jgi:IS5 family transposase
MFNGLFDFQSRLEKIDRNGDPLKRINALVDWSIFLTDLASLREQVDPTKGGRPPFDALLKFKMLILQALYNLSDDKLEQQVLDRLSFMRFLGLGIGDDVPDAKTIWAFRESLEERGLAEKLFARFDSFLNQAGFTAKRGQIVDASIVEVPIRRDSREINDKVKQGEEVSEWTPAARPQKDVDARWTRKNGDDFFGYKNHVCSDAEHKLIRAYAVTPASVHDSNVFEELLRPNSDPSVYADSAYISAARVESMLAPDSPWLPCLHEKGYTNHPLTDVQRQANRGRSRIRVRVEHVFAAQRQRAGHLLLRGIGIARATVKIGLRNLAYNMERFTLLVAPRPGCIVS